MLSAIGSADRARPWIEAELDERLTLLRKNDKLVEAYRLEQRTRYDLEMMLEVGYCSGIENYSRYLSGRGPGQPPPTLYDYLPEDTLVVVDDSIVRGTTLRESIITMLSRLNPRRIIIVSSSPPIM